MVDHKSPAKRGPAAPRDERAARKTEPEPAVPEDNVQNESAPVNAAFESSKWWII